MVKIVMKEDLYIGDMPYVFDDINTRQKQQYQWT